jgi:hypothetical protein
LAHVEEQLDKPHPYVLGGGNYSPKAPRTAVTVVVKGGKRIVGIDCMGVVAYALKVPRHRPGYNRGSWSSVIDWVNTDSAIQDADHERDLFEPVTDEPEPGDVLVWPSVYAGELSSPYKGKSGERRRIGHISLIIRVRIGRWDWNNPPYDKLDVVQGGSRHTPAIHTSTGAAWAGKQRTQWGTRPEWVSRILRPIL